MFDLDRRSRLRLVAGVGAVLVFLVFYIEDWGRDFTAYEAAVSSTAANELQRPLVVERSLRETVEAVKQAAGRIRNWEFAGEATDGASTAIYYVRQNRILRLRDDVIVTVQDMENTCVVDAVSRARLHVGDLGRNPRNLHRFMSELRTVLAGASQAALPAWSGPSGSLEAP